MPHLSKKTARKCAAFSSMKMRSAQAKYGVYRHTPLDAYVKVYQDLKREGIPNVASPR